MKFKDLLMPLWFKTYFAAGQRKKYWKIYNIYITVVEKVWWNFFSKVKIMKKLAFKISFGLDYHKQLNHISPEGRLYGFPEKNCCINQSWSGKKVKGIGGPRTKKLFLFIFIYVIALSFFFPKCGHTLFKSS